MNYPIANEWVSLSAQNVTTTAAQKIAASDIGPSGGPQRPLRWIGYCPDGDMYYGGPGVTSSTGFLLPAGVIEWFEATKGLGLHFVTGSGSTTLRILLGFNP